MYLLLEFELFAVVVNADTHKVTSHSISVADTAEVTFIYFFSLNDTSTAGLLKEWANPVIF